MEEPFQKMEKEGVPKNSQISDAALPTKAEEEKLPKLSAQEFSMYNHMAEHMDMFVSSCLLRAQGSRLCTD